MVQIILKNVLFQYVLPNIFISHMVQIIHIDAALSNLAIDYLYIPHGSDNTVMAQDLMQLSNAFISHMVQIILNFFSKFSINSFISLYPTWFR